jgi:hypothetical protein
MKTFFCVAIACVLGAQAATLDVANSASQVQFGITSAVDGDTVRVAAGSAAWTTNVVIANKAITLTGSGTLATIVSPTGAMQLVALSATNKLARLTNFKFTGGSAFYAYGSVAIGGTVCVDSCWFSALNSFNVFAYDCYGVLTSNRFDNPVGSSIYVYVYNQHYGGLPTIPNAPWTVEYGDGSWADYANWNSTNWFYIEHNSFDRPTAYAMVDGYRGTRFVFRYNDVRNGHVEVHGTESSQRFRGSRAIQVYGNNFDNPAHGMVSMVDLRSGTALICSNKGNGMSYPNAVQLVNDRILCTFPPWGQADGTNLFDSNIGLAASGTATGGGALTLVDGSRSWTNNGLVGLVLKDETQNWASEIVANTATTVTVAAGGGFGWCATRNGVAGDSYKIYRLDEILDQPGKGKGDLLSGDTPTPRNLHEADDPIYVWANTSDGGPAGVSVNCGALEERQGEHYILSALPGWTPTPDPHPIAAAFGLSGGGGGGTSGGGTGGATGGTDGGGGDTVTVTNVITLQKNVKVKGKVKFKVAN